MLKTVLDNRAIQLVLLTLLTSQCQGHGRLVEPPSRGSMWRLGYKTPHNYDDNQLFCGGVAVQYGKNGGKCGVCGDPWNGPLEHEAGGKYATGIIVRKYKVGQVIDVEVELTANHKGYFEFHICPNDHPYHRVTHECLEQHPLVVDTTGKEHFMVPDDGYAIDIKVKLRLPQGMKCSACMLQWKYNAGNSWGTDKDGKGCIGCGNQEQFYGCADVAVGHDEIPLNKTVPKRTSVNENSDSDINSMIGNSAARMINSHNQINSNAPNVNSPDGNSGGTRIIPLIQMHFFQLILLLPIYFLLN